MTGRDLQRDWQVGTNSPVDSTFWPRCCLCVGQAFGLRVRQRCMVRMLGPAAHGPAAEIRGFEYRSHKITIIVFLTIFQTIHKSLIYMDI